ncbi:hypothetical protein Hdeb2414_s0007g00242861 [Helianthus debilis subsp. tardiflorus]
MIKSELLQSFCMAPVNTPSHIRTPREQLQKQDDNAAADLYLNYDDDVYHVSMNLENHTEEADPEMIKLRRSKRLVKPAKSLLSPFVVFKNMKRRKNKIANDEDNLIKTIQDWAPSSGIRELTLTAGGSVGPDFCAALLGTDRTGWLSDDHIFGWMIHMYHSRVPSDRWSILPHISRCIVKLWIRRSKVTSPGRSNPLL